MRMYKKLFVFLGLIFGFFISGNFIVRGSEASTAATDKNETIPEVGCSFAKEYITSLEFIRSQKQFQIQEPEARKLALNIAKGCSGAAGRFIRIVAVLSRSGLSTQDSIKVGTDFVTRTQVEVETFLAVFQKAFLEENLNLDLRNSVHLAQSLTSEFNGDIRAVKRDFELLVDFCSGKGSEGLQLSFFQCGEFASRIAKIGEKFDGGVSNSYLRVFHFLADPKLGPGLTNSQSLELAQHIVSAGIKSPENFIQAYKYGVSKDGLALDVQAGIEFAKKLSIGLQAEKDAEIEKEEEPNTKS